MRQSGFYWLRARSGEFPPFLVRLFHMEGVAMVSTVGYEPKSRGLDDLLEIFEISERVPDPVWTET